MGGDKNKDYIRGGNRGGADQFKWEDVRMMAYKDREQYLGITERLGVLDKGGKWKRNNWYTKDKEGDQFDYGEFELIKAQEEATMRKNLGMPPKPGDEEILEAKNAGRKLEAYELNELTRRHGEQSDDEELDKADKMGGIGFNKAFHTGFNQEMDELLTKLDGVGVEQYKKLMKKLKKKEKKDKKDKKSKKAKKSKKSKKSKKRKHESSSSESPRKIKDSDSIKLKKRDLKAKQKSD